MPLTLRASALIPVPPLVRLLALLLGLCGPLARAAPTYPEPGVQVRAVQLSAHGYYIPGLAGAASRENEGFMSNAGFVVTPEGVVVFDTLASPSLAQAMLRRIRAVTDKPVRIVILSHYHADHYYGMQVFQEAGAEVWMHEAARGILGSQDQKLRFAQRKEILGRWINDETQRFPEPDRWISGDTDFRLGGLRFLLRHVGPAHTPEDLVLFVEGDQVLYAGDLVFKGRVPFVGEADSRQWLAALDRLIALQPRVLVPGHGQASDTPQQDLGLTRDYLRYLRTEMGRAVADLVPFEEAYRGTDWSVYQTLPAFEEANRRNAYNTYILMEKESLGP
ncbi:MAG TPA: MBL fold metallo-hydrolase [Thiobacillaceae bacterium]|nr:MBL fold metallo-hydrolase [Thiobacillaceae bacterium]HNU63080.1 MBL fold metallo-hydrolase [Thiobacillaceae bacterium]